MLARFLRHNRSCLRKRSPSARFVSLTPSCFSATSSSHILPTSPPLEFCKRSFATAAAKQASGVNADFTKDVEIVQAPAGEPSVINAWVREGRLGKDASHAVRKESNWSRIPAMLRTKEFKDNRKNVAAAQSILVDPAPLLAALKVGELYNTIFSLQVEGQDEPVQVICSEYEADLVYYKPQSFILDKFLPGRRYKVKLPVKFENEDDSVVIKKGGHLLRATMYAKCFWRGGVDIPRAVAVDVEHIRVGRVYKLDPNKMAPNLNLQHPERGMLVLGSCHGNRGAKDAGDEV